MPELQEKQTVYFARIIPKSAIYEVDELKIRTVVDDWYVGIDKRDKHAYMFKESDINHTIFLDRNIALQKVLDAESNKIAISNETYYEEY